MKRFTHKKAAVVAVSTLLALGGGGIAFAYFTSGGSGSGTAQVGATQGDAFTISTPGPQNYLFPGNGPQTFVIHVTNNTGQDAYVGTVYLSVATYGDTGDAATADGQDIPGCSASWFTVTPSYDIDHVVPADGSIDTSGDEAPAPSIEMPAANVDQDACQAASVGIAFTTSPS